MRTGLKATVKSLFQDEPGVNGPAGRLGEKRHQQNPTWVAPGALRCLHIYHHFQFSSIFD